MAKDPIRRRRFVSISRTVHLDATNVHTLDAIDDQGCAWWRVLNLEDWNHCPEWIQLTPLPNHENNHELPF
jgi:hypothetical protein